MNGKYRILIVDDEEKICKLIEKFLLKNGFDVLIACSGEDALNVIEKEEFDLMILDKRMPGINGVGVLRELLYRGMALPVIVLSGVQDLHGNIDEIKAMGYSDILVKPVELFFLLECINKKLNRNE
ncbi:MAG: response regulator [Candidatus Omnitrophica bacterium]|nr:response regulator [Candidatus Omnitrophota bacterium]